MLQLLENDLNMFLTSILVMGCEMEYWWFHFIFCHAFLLFLRYTSVYSTNGTYSFPSSFQSPVLANINKIREYFSCPVYTFRGGKICIFLKQRFLFQGRLCVLPLLTSFHTCELNTRSVDYLP